LGHGFFLEQKAIAINIDEAQKKTNSAENNVGVLFESWNPGV